MEKRTHTYIVYTAAILLVVIGLFVGIHSFYPHDGMVGKTGYVGSVSCRQCHENFYKLWSTSHHGLAMQPYTPEFAANELEPLAEPIRIGRYEYTVELGPGGGLMREFRGEGVPPSKRGQDARDTLAATHSQANPDDGKAYCVAHALGGRNVYYFLTPMERGRLQVLPLAYDLRRKEWFETAKSAVRHFPDADEDAPLKWTDPFYTFNTSCHGCHVSQLSTNYDPATDTYRTTWSEPGINCETCHGPGAEHVETFLAAASKASRVGLAPPVDDGGASPTLRSKPEELKLVSTKKFTVEQTNSQCASCHAKLSPVSPSFGAGERFFDHFDLVALEHQDYYPDGCDLGENYTYTSWRMSPCVKSGQLDCMHCHTSSGRYRFVGPGPANDVCLPCHAERVANATEHTHHAVDSEGNKCVACHMPTTEFARMTRSDHSMRPPAPSATLAFKSPNACNLCHSDRSAEWADKYVRQWHEDDYQQPVLEAGNLVRAARLRAWEGNVLRAARYEENGFADDQRVEGVPPSRPEGVPPSRPEADPASVGTKQGRDALATRGQSLSRDGRGNARDTGTPSTRLEDILEYIGKPDRDEIIATSLIRLLRASDSQKQWPVLIRALQKDPSPLVRSAAADVLGANLTDASFKALLEATRDEYRLVRVRAAASLASVPSEMLRDSDRQSLAAATAELKAALGARPDDYVSHYNLGNFYMDRRDYDEAISAFKKSIKLRPDYLPLYVNASLAYNAAGQNEKAEASLKEALKIDPNSVAAHLNLGMLLAEQGRMSEAETAFRDALSSDPNSAVAAYNLGVILAKDSMSEALKWCRKAAVLQPDNYRYVYTYAFYLRQGGSVEQAVRVLRGITDKQIPYPDAYFLLGDIYEKQQKFSKAREVYSAGLSLPNLSRQHKLSFLRRQESIYSSASGFPLSQE